jgi:hypothetical protein
MNINITELRIGNLLQDNGDGSGVHVVEGLRYGVIESSTYPFVSAFNYQPIKLTREILEVCGAEYVTEINPKIFNMSEGFRLSSTILTKWENGFLFHWVSGNTHLLYLHQLQNLYFTLTGKELEIDIDKINEIIKQ